MKESCAQFVVNIIESLQRSHASLVACIPTTERQLFDHLQVAFDGYASWGHIKTKIGVRETISSIRI